MLLKDSFVICPGMEGCEAPEIRGINVFSPPALALGKDCCPVVCGALVVAEMCIRKRFKLRLDSLSNARARKREHNWGLCLSVLLGLLRLGPEGCPAPVLPCALV